MERGEERGRRSNFSAHLYYVTQTQDQNTTQTTFKGTPDFVLSSTVLCIFKTDHIISSHIV